MANKDKKDKEVKIVYAEPESYFPQDILDKYFPEDEGTIEDCGGIAKEEQEAFHEMLDAIEKEKEEEAKKTQVNNMLTHEELHKALMEDEAARAEYERLKKKHAKMKTGLVYRDGDWVLEEDGYHKE